MKRLLALVVGLALALVGSMAVAAWLSTGTANGAVTAASLAAPTAVAGASTSGSGAVAVSWAGSSGDLTPLGYYVFRTPASGPAEPACGSSLAALVTSTSCTDTSVPVGSYSYTVVAVFHSWVRASAPSAQVSVAKADQVVTFTSTPVNPTYGGTYQLSASGGGSGNPIVFGTSTSDVCTVSGSKVSFVHAGACMLTADQAGSTYYNAAPRATQQFQVAKAAQVIAFGPGAPTTVVVGGTGYTPLATGGASGNPVTFTIDAASSTVCAISGGVVSYAHVGTCVIDADQAGNGDYLDANRVQQSIAVGQAAQAINFTSAPPSSAKVNDTYTVSATGGSSGNPVTFSSGSPTVCSVTGSTVTFSGAGTCIVNADQAGNADYLPAATTHQSIDVTKTDQTIVFASAAPDPGAVGTTYTPVATASSGLPVAIAVAGNCSISSGIVTFGPSAGVCTITATQDGNDAFNAATPVEQSVAVTSAGPVITACTRNVSSGEITVKWSAFAGATSYKLALSTSASLVASVTSPFTTTTIGKNNSGTVRVVAVTAGGDVYGTAWTYDGSGTNQRCHS